MDVMLLFVFFRAITQHNLSSEYSMITFLHTTSLIMLSCHFRYFVVILLCFEKCNILLCRLQLRCILNVLMYEVNHLYRWWMGVGQGHFLWELHRFTEQSVWDGMTQIGTCLSNIPQFLCVNNGIVHNKLYIMY